MGLCACATKDRRLPAARIHWERNKTRIGNEDNHLLSATSPFFCLVAVGKCLERQDSLTLILAMAWQMQFICSEFCKYLWSKNFWRKTWLYTIFNTVIVSWTSYCKLAHRKDFEYYTVLEFWQFCIFILIARIYGNDNPDNRLSRDLLVYQSVFHSLSSFM